MSEQLNVDLRDGYKEKLRNIAKKQNRNMTGQIHHWIDQSDTDTDNKTENQSGNKWNLP